MSRLTDTIEILSSLVLCPGAVKARSYCDDNDIFILVSLLLLSQLGTNPFDDVVIAIAVATGLLVRPMLPILDGKNKKDFPLPLSSQFERTLKI